MKVLASIRAKNSYHKIKNDIELKWGEIVAKSFEQKIKDFFDLLELFPKIGTLHDQDKNIRSFQLTKQTRVFYRIKNNRITILVFFEVAQSPNKKF